jgi:hypothetical protein
VSSSEQRERAEAAFAHLQHAAQEIVAAAHDTLELVEQVVSSAKLGDVLDGLGHLAHRGQSMFTWPRPNGGPRSGDTPTSEEPGSEEAPTHAAPPDQQPMPDAGRHRPRRHSPVERISVR